jgi:hypothetical protein
MAPTTAIAHLAAMAAPKLGSNFTRPSPLEVECAEKLLEVVPGAEMAKFTKDGSTATTAAVRLARASLHGRRCGSVLHAGVRQSPQRQEDRRQAQGLTAGSIDDYRRASAGSRRASLAPHCAAAALHNNRFGARAVGLVHRIAVAFEEAVHVRLVVFALVELVLFAAAAGGEPPPRACGGIAGQSSRSGLARHHHHNATILVQSVLGTGIFLLVSFTVGRRFVLV